MYRLSELKKKLSEGKILLACNSLFSDPAVSELLAMAGNDIVWIDMEHAAIDYKDVQLHIIAAHSGGAAAIVRIPWNDQVVVKKVLDMGPDGIMFPFIRSAAEVTSAVEACAYPPKGIRGWNPIRAAEYGLRDGHWYKDNADKLVWKVIMLEHIDAVSDIDNILAIDGLDAVMIGPSDLSGSMGKLLQMYDDDVQAAIDTVAQKCKAADIPFGVALGCGASPELYRFWIDKGISIISLGQDVNLMVQAVGSNIGNFNIAMTL